MTEHTRRTTKLLRRGLRFLWSQVPARPGQDDHQACALHRGRLGRARRARRHALGLCGTGVCACHHSNRALCDQDARFSQMPRGCCWIEGDNPSCSNDSRSFGPVPLALIEARVAAVIWPPWRAGPVSSRLPTTPAVAAQPPPAETKPPAAAVSTPGSVPAAAPASAPAATTADGQVNCSSQARREF